MKVVFTPNARDDIDQRFEYTERNFGHPVAQKIFGRMDTFIHHTLANFPFTGSPHPSGVLETWVPRTPFFVIYKIDQTADVLTVLAVFHHAQDRSSFKPTSET